MKLVFASHLQNLAMFLCFAWHCISAYRLRASYW